MSTRRKKGLGQGTRHGLTQDEYYLNEQGFMVFTEAYHLKRGYCCKSGCRHCPYGYQKPDDLPKKH